MSLLIYKTESKEIALNKYVQEILLKRVADQTYKRASKDLGVTARDVFRFYKDGFNLLDHFEKFVKAATSLINSSAEIGIDTIHCKIKELTKKLMERFPLILQWFLQKPCLNK